MKLFFCLFWFPILFFIIAPICHPSFIPLTIFTLLTVIDGFLYMHLYKTYGNTIQDLHYRTYSLSSFYILWQIYKGNIKKDTVENDDTIKELQ